MYNILVGHVLDKLKELPTGKVQTIITSPPYYAMRSYGTEPQLWDTDGRCDHAFEEIKIRRANLSGGQSKKQMTNKGSFGVDYNDRYSYSERCYSCGAWKGELGQEPTVQLYVKHLVEVFKECHRVLADDGVLWVNIADTYIDSGKERKGLYLVPERFAIAMADSGDWLCRMENIWHVTNKMPTSVTDRFNVDHEKMFMFIKQQKYFFEQQYVDDKSGGQRIMRTVWDIPNGAKAGSNTASFPKELVRIPVLSTSRVGDIVLDPFCGTGTVIEVCEELDRRSVGIDIREDFININL